MSKQGEINRKRKTEVFFGLSSIVLCSGRIYRSTQNDLMSQENENYSS